MPLVPHKSLLLCLCVVPLSMLQEESKFQKKKNASLKAELQETSKALLALLEEIRK